MKERTNIRKTMALIFTQNIKIYMKLHQRTSEKYHKTVPKTSKRKKTVTVESNAKRVASRGEIGVWVEYRFQSCTLVNTDTMSINTVMTASYCNTFQFNIIEWIKV